MDEIPLTNIITEGKKELPQNSLIRVRLGRVPETVTVDVKFPGQQQFVSYESLPVDNGVVTLPIKLSFLSHAKEDVAFVRHVCGSLLNDGILAWFDEKDLLPGDDWKSKIDEAIEKSDYVVVFLSRYSTDKIGYFQRELKYALEQQELRPQGHRYIIPVLIDDCEPPRSLKASHWLRSNGDSWYKKLVEAIRAK